MTKKELYSNLRGRLALSGLIMLTSGLIAIGPISVIGANAAPKSKAVSEVANPNPWIRLDHIVVTPGIGTYFPNKTYEFSVKAFDGRGRQIKEGVTFHWKMSVPTINTTQYIQSSEVGADGIGKAYITPIPYDIRSTGWSTLIIVTACDKTGRVRTGHAGMMVVNTGMNRYQ